MPSIKNVQTGHTHSVSIAMWDAIWEEKCKKEPTKYKHVPFEGMNMADISIPFIDESFTGLDSIPYVSADIEAVEDEFEDLEEFTPVGLGQVLANLVVEASKDAEVAPLIVKKRGRPRKVS